MAREAVKMSMLVKAGATPRKNLMPRTDNLYELPKNLPVLVDDGACDHLLSMQIPSVPLMSTAGRIVDLASLTVEEPLCIAIHALADLTETCL